MSTPAKSDHVAQVSERQRRRRHLPDCFGCGPDNPLGLRLQIVSGPGTATAVGRFHIGQHGGPGLVHGGVLTTMCDEAMGAVGGVGGNVRLTKSLEISFRKPVELDRDVEAIATVVSHDGNRYRASAIVRYVDGSTDGDSSVLVEAVAQFVVIA
jgi:acyl-coenzyme A thioesterase PaaI-like protein